MDELSLRADRNDGAVSALATEVAENRAALENAGDELGVLRANASTLKANLVGLGDYINTINGIQYTTLTLIIITLIINPGLTEYSSYNR